MAASPDRVRRLAPEKERGPSPLRRREERGAGTGTESQRRRGAVFSCGEEVLNGSNEALDRSERQSNACVMLTPGLKAGGGGQFLGAERRAEHRFATF